MWNLWGRINKVYCRGVVSKVERGIIEIGVLDLEFKEEGLVN